MCAAAGFAAAQTIAAELVLYDKQDTWTETMLVTRANYVRHRQAEQQKSGTAPAQPLVTEPIQGEGPGQQISVSVAGCRWMRLATVLEQGGGNCHIWGDAKLIAADGSVTWLGDLKPVFIRVGWGQLLVDKNWQDQPLQIGNRKFERGIWVHSDSNVGYALDGKYERFEAWVGMDAARAIGVARSWIPHGIVSRPILADRSIAALAASG
jgi:hypothetical protein